MAAGSNFNLLPQEISTDYFGDANDLTKRAKERGYNFFVNGYVHALKVNSSSKNIVDISAKCYRSVRKSEQPHRIDMTIHTQERRITDSHCSCKAGIPELKEDDIKKLKVDKSTPLSYLLQDELHTEKTEYGIVQKGSMLPLQLPDSCNHGEHIQLRID